MGHLTLLSTFRRPEEKKKQNFPKKTKPLILVKQFLIAANSMKVKNPKLDEGKTLRKIREHKN